jgi:SAM-dependent methyltransferase
MDVPAKNLRLNLGCGRHVLDGWYNVDLAVSAQAARPPDLLCDVKRLPMLPDQCAVELMAIHVFEHFYYWECDGAVREWHRLLKPDGLLILEMPDLYKFSRNVLKKVAGDKALDGLGMWGMYGDPREKDPLMVHHWGWTFETLRPFLADRGFTNIAEAIPRWHPGGRANRDFRIEARRKT